MNRERLMKVLLAPHVSEKGTSLADKSSQVVFKVARDATKLEVKRAVELLFEVQVEQVRTAVMSGKLKRQGRSMGRRSDWKKAYVRLQPGQDIDFASAE